MRLGVKLGASKKLSSLHEGAANCIKGWLLSPLPIPMKIVDYVAIQFPFHQIVVPAISRLIFGKRFAYNIEKELNVSVRLFDEMEGALVAQI